MSLTKHSYNEENVKDERIPSIFKKFFSDYQPKSNSKTASNDQWIKVASNCISCPYAGNVSAQTCNSCKHAIGISYQDSIPYVKCSYVDEKMTSMSQRSFNQVLEEDSEKQKAELKWAAHKMGVKLAQEHFDEFSKQASNEKLCGKNLEKAAHRFVTKIETRISPATSRKNSGILNEIFANVNKGPHTVVSGLSSPSVGDNDNTGCGYLGSKVNPNTIWEPDALIKAAQKPGNDEKTANAKIEISQKKQSIKESYWKALQEKLSSKDLISSQKVHSLSTEQTAGFNTNLPANAMGIFGDHKDFENIPEKTAGETIAKNNETRATKKKVENQEVQIKAAQTCESDNWLFK